MKKIFFCLLASLILSFSFVPVYGDTMTEEDMKAAEEGVTKQEEEKVACSFSEPTVTKKDGAIVYQTQLCVDNIDKIEGYQIAVESKEKDRVAISNQAGGMETENVYKDDTMNLAVISSSVKEKGSPICDITVSYDYQDHEKDRALVVSDLQLVNSVAEEKILDGGPYVLELPYVEPPFYANYKFYLAVLLGVALIAGTIVIQRKRRKQFQTPAAV